MLHAHAMNNKIIKSSSNTTISIYANKHIITLTQTHMNYGIIRINQTITTNIIIEITMTIFITT